MSTPPDEVTVERSTELLHPLALAQVQTLHQMGLRNRTLTLPVMMALGSSMIWRQIGSVLDLTRIVQHNKSRYTGRSQNQS